MKAVILGFGLALLAAPALADDLPRLAELGFRQDPSFVHLGDAGPFYPDAAFRRRVGGEVVMDCDLAATGVLSRCKVQAEEPTGMDFRFATLRMAETRWMIGRPRVEDGVLVASERVRVRVVFTLPKRD